MQIDKPDRHAGERVRELRKEEGYKIGRAHV